MRRLLPGWLLPGSSIPNTYWLPGERLSLLNRHLARLHFGLGAAKVVDLVEVRWPLGLVESFKNVDTNQLLVLQEGVTQLFDSERIATG